ncbi:MAG: hypothetical protein FWF44_10805, partial [Defluviitaleaceae bacterium]|nr:hypothetical protein [Defluviitaleaceae bacterium]
MKAIFLNDNTPAVFNNVFTPEIQKRLRSEIGLHPGVITGAALPEFAETSGDIEFIFSTWGMPRLSEADITAYLPALKAVFYAAGTVQDFARPFLKRGIKVYSAWGANAVPVAEYAAAQIVLAGKGFYQSAATFKKDYGAARRYSEGFPGNYGAKVGLIGCGMIGGIVARMLRAYRLEVLVYDPFLSDGRAEELGVKKRSLEEIFAECQTISNHLANNEQTKGILDYGLFSRMKPNAAFINT